MIFSLNVFVSGLFDMDDPQEASGSSTTPASTWDEVFFRKTLESETNLGRSLKTKSKATSHQYACLDCGSKLVRNSKSYLLRHKKEGHAGDLTYEPFKSVVHIDSPKYLRKRQSDGTNPPPKKTKKHGTDSKLFGV